jgi:hypothetical protein
MSNLRSQAETTQANVKRVHGHHSAKTYYPDQPGIEPWMRDTLVALQVAINSLAETQVAIAEQVDKNTTRLRRLEQQIARS